MKKVAFVGLFESGVDTINYLKKQEHLDCTTIVLHTEDTMTTRSQADQHIVLHNEEDITKNENILSLFKEYETIMISNSLGEGPSVHVLVALAALGKEHNVNTIGFAQLPFGWEGLEKVTFAELSLEDMKKNMDCVSVIDNNEVRTHLKVSGKKVSLKDFFSIGDEIIYQSVKNILALPDFQKETVEDIIASQIATLDTQIA